MCKRSLPLWAQHWLIVNCKVLMLQSFRILLPMKVQRACFDRRLFRENYLKFENCVYKVSKIKFEIFLPPSKFPTTWSKDTGFLFLRFALITIKTNNNIHSPRCRSNFIGCPRRRDNSPRQGQFYPVHPHTTLKSIQFALHKRINNN